MLLHVRSNIHRLPRSALRTPTFPNQSGARFTNCARRVEQHTTNHKPVTDEQTESESSRDDGARTKTAGRFRLPALLLFATGFPLGWYLKGHYDQLHYRQVSAPDEFVKYTLSAKDNVSSTSAIFRLKPSSNVTVDQDDPSLERAITSIEFKQPQLNIARSYTCLPQEHGQDMNELRFLIRREEKGEVSNFIHRLAVGSDIEVRGLHSEYLLPHDIKSAVFLVGGTGIAPAMQAVDIIDGMANTHILWANRRREDCIGGYNDTTLSRGVTTWWSGSTPRNEVIDRNMARAEKGALVTILENLKSQSRASSEEPPRLSVNYFVDEEGTFIKPDDVKNVLSDLSRKDGDAVQGRRILFVSGPEGFISHWAGSKHWANGVEVQGPLRGVLSTMDLSGWEVVKL